MLRTLGSASSAVVSLLYTLGWIASPANETAPPSGYSFSDGSAGFVDATACDWWVPSQANDTAQACGPVDLRLMTGGALSESKLLAERCMRATNTTCLLSHEVRFDVPAVFLWDPRRLGLRVLISPQRNLTWEESAPTARVAVGDPVADVAATQNADPFLRVYNFKRRVLVTYMETGPEKEQTAESGRGSAGASGAGIRVGEGVLEDMDAYCVQLLSMSLSSDCNV